MDTSNDTTTGQPVSSDDNYRPEPKFRIWERVWCDGGKATINGMIYRRNEWQYWLGGEAPVPERVLRRNRFQVGDRVKIVVNGMVGVITALKSGPGNPSYPYSTSSQNVEGYSWPESDLEPALEEGILCPVCDLPLSSKNGCHGFVSTPLPCPSFEGKSGPWPHTCPTCGTVFVHTRPSESVVWIKNVERDSSDEPSMGPCFKRVNPDGTRNHCYSNHWERCVGAWQLIYDGVAVVMEVK